MVKYEKIEGDGKLPIKLIRFINDLNGPIEKHWHNSIEIVVPLSGKGSAWINGKTYDYVGMNLNEGGHDIFIVNSKSIHSFESYKEDIPYYGYVLQINYDFLKTVYFQIDQINFIQHPGHQISRKVKQMIWELDETYQCQSEYKNALIMSKIYEIIFYLLENATSSKENCVENKSEKNKKRIKQQIFFRKCDMLFSDCSGSLRGFPYITEEKENKGEEVEEIFCFVRFYRRPSAAWRAIRFVWRQM